MDNARDTRLASKHLELVYRNRENAFRLAVADLLRDQTLKNRWLEQRIAGHQLRARGASLPSVNLPADLRQIPAERSPVHATPVPALVAAPLAARST